MESTRNTAKTRKVAASLVAAAMALAGVTAAAPALATSAPKRPKLTIEDAPDFRLRPTTLAVSGPTLDVSRFQFTAPGRAPARTAAAERTFRFTPSGAPSRNAIAIGVTSRAVLPAAATGGAAARAAAPTEAAASAYAVDLSVAWRGFAVQGGVSRADPAAPTLMPREGVDVGLSYGQSRWRTALLATAERGGLVAGAPMLEAARLEPRYAFEATGAFALSPKLSVNGGLRYRLSPQNPGPLEMNAEDRAVFVGGALAF